MFLILRSRYLSLPRGGAKASGEINGLHFEDFRQWIRDNDNRCKGKDCKDSNYYLHSSEYNRDTMERSRALIGGTPKEGGSYECKVFAFHQKPGDKDSKDYSASLTAFENASSGDSIALQSLFTNYETAKKDAKGSEWVAGSFYFKIKLKDNQKYNPTYVKMPTIQAGKSIKDGRYSSPTKDNISTDQPKSTKDGNDVSEDDRASILVGDLPDGTWFEIKNLIKKVDKKDPKDCPKESVQWSRFEDFEDNVKRGADNKPVKDKNGKVVTLDQSSREYGAVTFRPDKWQSAGEYWAEVRVHYPDGSVSDGEGSVNEKHPVYAKVNVTAKPGNNTFGLNLFRYTTDSQYRTISVENGINLHPGDLLAGNDRPMFDSYLTNAIGNLHQHMICSKQDKNGKQTDYTYGILPGHVNNEKSQKDSEKDGLRLLEPQTIWKHSSLKDQFECNTNGKKCKSDTYLYDDWVDSDKSYNTFERTHGSFGGVAQKTGDYVCKVYVIKGDQKKSDAFKNAVESNIKSKKNEDPVTSVLNARGNPYGKEGEDYKIGAFSVHIHRDNHFYNPEYAAVSVKAGQKVENVVPKSVKSANGADKYQDAVKAGALPDGTWFEFKDATHGFEVKADSTVGNKVSLDWSYWAGNAADNSGDQSNKPDDTKQKNGKHNAKGDGTRYGKVTFHPDQSVAPKAYLKEIVIHYPDGSTSDDPDSGNNGKPVYAKVTVGSLSGADKDLKMILLRSQDADPVDTLGGGNSLTVMSGTSLTKNPYVRAWSLKDRSNISLRMMCTKQGEKKWSRGLDNTLNMHLNQNYGEKVQPWAFASAEQRKSCSQDGKTCVANLLYGFTKNGKQDSIESAVSRSEDDIVGVPKKAGNYTCAVFALKPNALTVFNNTVNAGLSDDKKYSSTDMKNTWFEGVAIGKDWNRIAVDVNVIDPPKFALPKTGGMNWNMLLGGVVFVGTSLMFIALLLDQSKWGRALIAEIINIIKVFIRKTARKWRIERWRC
ncbi:hypothetical protein [Gardnerella vaginalis]|uniref:hypothetical protein n=1 Tax=Gardnerella vaginalis TaxID=2702 RepID=UPI001FF19281|nr:hypothetical protein [Gardnerella vaginalis]